MCFTCLDTVCQREKKEKKIGRKWKRDKVKMSKERCGLRGRETIKYPERPRDMAKRKQPRPKGSNRKTDERRKREKYGG